MRSAPLALLLAALGCFASAPRSGPGPCPVAPLASEAVPEGLFLRLRMHLEGGGREYRLEVVAAREGGELVTVGLSPMGVRLFALRQRGLAVEADGAAPGLAPPAAWVSDAVYRAIDYSFGADDPPRDMGIDNPWCGYRGRVVTLEAAAGQTAPESGETSLP